MASPLLSAPARRPGAGARTTLAGELRRHGLKALALALLALAGLHLLRAAAPPPGTRDVAAQMPWVQPHLGALRAAWRAAAAGGDHAPSGAARCRESAAHSAFRGIRARVMPLLNAHATRPAWLRRLGGGGAVRQHDAA
jgi:hypothetical protein